MLHPDFQSFLRKSGDKHNTGITYLLPSREKVNCSCFGAEQTIVSLDGLDQDIYSTG